MSKYDKLDAAIVAHIAGGSGKSVYYSLRANKLAEDFSDRNTPVFRVIDRRLQALRKAGRIHYGGKKVGWLVTAAA